MIVQLGGVKIHQAAVEALRENESQDETQFITKTDGFMSFIPPWMLMYFFAGFLKISPCDMTKLRVVVLCFSYFTDNSNLIRFFTNFTFHFMIYIIFNFMLKWFFNFIFDHTLESDLFRLKHKSIAEDFCVLKTFWSPNRSMWRSFTTDKDFFLLTTFWSLAKD